MSDQESKKEVTPVLADAPAVESVQTPAEPTEYFGIFCGDINLQNMQYLTRWLTVATGSNVNRIHILFQTWGGNVGEGVYLYNLLKSFPIEVVIYNCGQISSSGVISYLGARVRKTTKNATFMIHKSHVSPQFANAEKLKSVADSLVLDDKRTEEILREHVELPPELWEKHKYADVFISGEEAVEFGIADGVAEFAPPAGTLIYNLLLPN